MGKRLKIGLLFMVAAVVMMPLAILLKDVHQSATVVVLILSMVLEIIGLVFVALNILTRKKI